MTTARTASALLAGGALCFLVGGLAIVLRTTGTDVIAHEQTTVLAAAGMMLVAVGASMKRR